MWLSLTVISMSSHTQPQKVQVESSMRVTDGSAGLTAVLMSLTQLLQSDIKALARGHPGSVGLTVHQPAREIPVGNKQQARRQLVAGRGGDGHLDLPATLRRDAHAVSVGQPQALHIRRRHLQGRDFVLVAVFEFPFADTAPLLAGPSGNEDKRLKYRHFESTALDRT